MSRLDPDAEPVADADERVADGEAYRRERVGEPVVRADPAVTGERASEAVDFDPDDPASLDRAAEAVARFVAGDAAETDNVAMLRGAAACAALVRGLGSYRAAAERVGDVAQRRSAAGQMEYDDVPVSVIRKWARVHDLPQSVRRHVARGDVAPSAAKHVARVDGRDRLDLAWAVVDHDLTVREVRGLASEVNDGAPAVVALRRHGVELGDLRLSLPAGVYRELRREASMRNCAPGDVVAEVLDERFADG